VYCVLSLGVMVALHFRKVWVLWKWLVMRVRFGGNLRERERERERERSGH
jgi:hypothetical protein